VHEWLADAGRRLAESVGDDEAAYGLDAEATRRVLDLARIAAHESGDRTNAPMLAYLVGLAHGRHPGRTLSDLVDIAVKPD
jgi:hypothetical protein